MTSRLFAVLAILSFAAYAQPRQGQSTEEKERALGEQLAEEVERAGTIVDDVTIVSYLNGVARKLSAHCAVKTPVEVRVIQSDEMNGSVLPGGILYANTGLIRHSESEAEVAGVLAYLTAFIQSGALTRQREHGQIMNYESIPVIFMGSLSGYSFRPGKGMAIPLGFLERYRSAVIEADEGGVRCLADAGYDPEAFLEDLKKLEPDGAKSSTHPPRAERIEKAQAVMATLEHRPESVVSTAAFDEVKRKVEAFHERQHRQRAAAPSLRRN